jgi:5-methylcytosine-specific restriction enzyme A
MKTIWRKLPDDLESAVSIKKSSQLHGSAFPPLALRSQACLVKSPCGFPKASDGKMGDQQPQSPYGQASRSAGRPPHVSPDWRDWYQLQRWRKIAKHQLKIEPLCKLCLAAGIASRATIADHVESHRGDWNSFILGKLQSLCKPCHDSTKRTLRGFHPAIGEDGFPIDPRHPVYGVRSNMDATPVDDDEND